MKDVGSWTPAAAELGVAHREVLDGSVEVTDEPRFDRTGAELDRLREVMTATPEAVRGFIDGVDSSTLIGWVRVLTRAESLPGCDVGPKSPVIALARTLRERGEYPDTLTAWIRSHSNNRFLPYGSLMDRL